MNRPRWTVLALLVLAGLTACGPTTRPPDPDVSGMEPDVIQLLNESREEVLDHPRSGRAWGRLAAAYQVHGLLDEAERCCREAVRLEPGEFRWSYLLAVVREVNGADADEIMALFDDAIALRPDYAPAHLRLGLALLRRGLHDQARSAFRKTIDLAPDTALAHRALGQILLAADQIEQAVESLTRAARLRPEDGAAHAGLAQAYRRLGNLELAEESAKRAGQRTPFVGFADPIMAQEVRSLGASTTLRFGRAQRMITEGNLDEARREVTLIREARPQDADAYYLSGLLASREERLEEAEVHFSRALELNAEHVLALGGLAAVLERGGRLEEALRHRRRAHEILPRDPSLLVAMTPALDALGDFDRLIEVYEKLAALLPETASVQVDLGTARGRQGDFERAAAHFRDALRLDPDSVEGHYRLGVALEMMGQTVGAIDQYETVLRLEPSHAARARLDRLRGDR